MTVSDAVCRRLRSPLVILAVCCWPLAVATAEAPRSHLVPAGNAATAPPTSAGLGLVLTRASAVLRQQLALSRGAGLVVERVTPGSRAARAGFAQHDVLVKLDDQLLVLPEQLDALLEAADREAPLDCTVLRGGRELVIPLVQPPVGIVRAPRTTSVGGGLRPTASSLAIVAEATPKQKPAAEASRLRRLADETLVRQDSDFQIRLTSGEELRLVVADPQGRVVFDAAIDAPEARGRVPEAVRERVLEMERMLEDRPPQSVAVGRPLPKAAKSMPAAEVGRLDVSPVELR